MWLLGFVTAEEMFIEKPRYKNPDNAALIAWVSNYCAKSPLDQLLNAAFSLTIELRNDPADLEKYKEIIRGLFRGKCEAGDKEACKSIDQLR